MTFFRSCGDIFTELGHSQVRLSKLCWQSAAFTQASIYKVLFTLMMFCWCARSHTTVQPVVCIFSPPTHFWALTPWTFPTFKASLLERENCCDWFFDCAKDMKYLPWQTQAICSSNNQTLKFSPCESYLGHVKATLSSAFQLVAVWANCRLVLLLFFFLSGLFRIHS